MAYKIISGQYELGTEEQQAGYKMLFGEDNIQYKFVKRKLRKSMQNSEQLFIGISRCISLFINEG